MNNIETENKGPTFGVFAASMLLLVVLIGVALLSLGIIRKKVETIKEDVVEIKAMLNDTKTLFGEMKQTNSGYTIKHIYQCEDCRRKSELPNMFPPADNNWRNKPVGHPDRDGLRKCNGCGQVPCICPIIPAGG